MVCVVFETFAECQEVLLSARFDHISIDWIPVIQETMNFNNAAAFNGNLEIADDVGPTSERRIKITCIQGPAGSGKTTRLRYLTYGKKVSFEPCGESRWVQHRDGNIVAFADVNSERELNVVKSKLEQLRAGKVDVFNSIPVVLADKVEHVFVEGAADFSSMAAVSGADVSFVTCCA